MFFYLTPRSQRGSSPTAVAATRPRDFSPFFLRSCRSLSSMFVACCYGHVIALKNRRLSPKPGDNQANLSLLFSTLCLHCSAMSYADFAHLDDPSPREPNPVSLGAVLFVDEFEEEALVNLGSLLRKRAQQ